MKTRLLGYSERGIVNALCEDIHNAEQPLAVLAEFLSWFDFCGQHVAPDFSNITHATLLVEQSFEPFGDLDLLILLDLPGQRHAFLIEAKVSTDTNAWATIESRWGELLRILNDTCDNTSNLFVQLHRKVRLVEKLRSSSAFEVDCLIPNGNFGAHRIVKKACDELREYLLHGGTAWFGAILPDHREALMSFGNKTLRANSVENLPTWDASHWGLLSWQTISEKVTGEGWPRTVATFDWNRGQIFRTTTPIRPALSKDQVCRHEDRFVYVVVPSKQNCRVVELDQPDFGYFWKTKLIPTSELVPIENPGINAPELPQPDTVYEWHSRGEVPPLPINELGLTLEEGCRVRVTGPSWRQTRVCQEDGPQESFLVHTHQLLRIIPNSV